MRIVFLGTRGYIEQQTKSHYRHTSTLLIHKNKKIMIDCGLDWLKKVWRVNPDAIVLTHAHPDHVEGLKYGAPCPVYATRTCWRAIKNYLIADNQRHILKINTPINIYGLTFTALSNKHSLRAPAISYRISDGVKNIFYSGDIVYIPQIKKALKNISLYIGDGATLTKSLVRRTPDGDIYGHAAISTQLTWCKKAGVKDAIFTHCGSQIVKNQRAAQKIIKQLGFARGVIASIAYDNQMLIV